MKPKISVITPIYNASEHLKITIDSVLSQSFKDFELILVDDGSVDNSLEICKKYAESDSRIIVIHQENQGVAIARQSGLVKTTGDYIIHLDADDFFFSDALERLYRHAIDTDSDIIIGNYEVSYPDSCSEICSYSYKTLASDQLIDKIFLGKIHGALWNKLIKKEMYKDLCFEPGLDFMEDVLMLVKMSLKYNLNISLLKGSPIYSYNQRQDSYTNSYTVEYLQKGAILINRIEELLVQGKRANSLNLLKKMKINILKLYIFDTNSKTKKLSSTFPDITIKDIWNSSYSLHIKFIICSRLFGLNFPERLYKRFRAITDK